jgi:hypothetical protein
MSDLDKLFSQIPMGELAAKLKLKEDVALAGVATGLPALLQGLSANVQDAAGAASLLKALETKDPSLVKGKIDLDSIDVKDGKKIVKNIYGKATPKVAARLSDAAGISGGAIKKILPLLAPIVLAFLASKVLGGKSKSKSTGGNVLGDILGGILGGGGLGDILGGMLGGGSNLTSKSKTKSKSSGAFDGLGDLLGGLLGGGKR